ncbi:MAG: hypothetical protein Q4C22_04925, partial [Bacillota bacterium]|nr:hypothetical protein [Bacillota bacterium]
MNEYTYELLSLLKNKFTQVVGVRSFQTDEGARAFYLRELEDNLREPMGEAALRAYGQGSGNEIASGKMHALRSSSAMTYNLFGNRAARVCAAQSADSVIGGGVYAVEFEKQFH